jgi:glycosyltransferase involved in cell wall biosynthesis
VISILLPVYNSSATIEKAIESLLRQTYGDFEVVAVDDGSTDGTTEILHHLEKRDSRVRPVIAPHAGLVPALNLGLTHCRGEFLARMDGDDICHPERLRLQLDYMTAHPEVSVVSSLVCSFPRSAMREGFKKYELWLNSLTSHEEIAHDIFVESPVAHPSVLLRTAELRKLGGYQEHGWPEDYDLWLRYFTAGKRFAKVPETLLFWRAHKSRLTFTDSRYALENFIRAKAHYLAKMLKKEHPEVIIWGAGMTSRRLSKHLVREGLSIKCAVDIDPEKIGRTMRGIPIVAPEALSEHRKTFVITAVGSAEARKIIRDYLDGTGRVETRDYICAS